MASLALVFDILAKDSASDTFRRVGGEAENAGKRTEGALGRISGAAKVAGAAIAGSAIVAGLTSAVSAAADAEQSLGGVQAVFKNYANGVIGDSKRASQQVGLSANDYRELATVIGSQMKNAGVSFEQLGAKTESVIQIGADLAAQFGGSSQEAVEALSSAFRGEFDPIEKYGISLSAAAVGAKAVEMGLSDSADQLDQSAKLQATLALVTQQSADAQGAFGREADTASGRAQRAAAQWEDLKTAVGDKLLPVWSATADVLNTSVLPFLGSVVDVVGKAVGVFADLPGPVQIAVGVLGGLAAFKNPLTDMFETVALKALYAADSIGGASLSMGTLKSVGSGIVGFFGGPWGLALAGAATGLSLLVNWLGSTDDATKDAESATRSYIDAIKQANGVIDDNVRKGAAQTLSADGVFKAFEGASITARQFTDAVTVQGDQLDSVRGRMQSYIDSLYRQSDAASLAGDPALAARLGDQAHAAEVAAGKFDGLAADTSETATQARDVAAAVDSATGSVEGATGPTGDYAAQLEAAADAADAAKKQTDQFKLSLDILTGAHVSLIEVESAYQASLDDARDSLEGMTGAVLDNTGHLNLNDEAGREVQDRLINLKDSSNQLIATMVEQGDTASSVRDKDAQLRDSFYKTAVQMTGSKEEAKRLTDQIYGIPDSRTTTINADVSKARGTLEDFIAGVTGKSIVLTGEFKSGPGVNVRRALGGAVFGPGTETSDSIPALLSNNEHVWTAAEVRGAGGHDAVEGLRQAARRGTLATFADGGRVVLSDSYAIPVSIAGLPNPASISAGGVLGSGATGTGWASLFNAVKAAFPAARVNSAYRPGDPGYHGLGKAVDLGYGFGPGGAGNAGLAAMKDWLYDRMGSNLAELIYDGLGADRPDIKNGRNHTYDAATRAQHHNHVHAAVYGQGTNYVPADGFAYLHRGEAVVPAAANQGAPYSPGAANRGAPLMHVEHQHIGENVDLDLLLRQAQYRERTGAFS